MYKDCPFCVCQSLLIFKLQLKKPRGSKQTGLIIVYHWTQQHFHSIWHIIPGIVTGKEIALGKNMKELHTFLLASYMLGLHLSFRTFTLNSSSS